MHNAPAYQACSWRADVFGEPIQVAQLLTKLKCQAQYFSVLKHAGSMFKLPGQIHYGPGHTALAPSQSSHAPHPTFRFKPQLSELLFPV